MKRGPSQVILALDLLANSLLFGDGRQTLSERTGKGLERGKRWAKLAAPVIDFILRSKDHCREQWEEAKRRGAT